LSESARRIDGWKAIAAHFRRDRSTVMRWASASDFPVRRGPGGKGASVWAYAHELDAWLAGLSGGAPSPEALQPAQRRLGRPILVAAGLLAVAAMGVGAALYLARGAAAPAAPPQKLPSDPAVADLYLQARDDWAARTPETLQKAMAEFGEVTSRDPGFAPAYAGLADVHLLTREYEAVPDAVAYPKAEAAAKLALRLDPRSADANRALGFIDFGWRHDIAAARVHFGRSLRAAPNDAQTHFWFGNMLIGVGDDAAALAELRTARRLDPGSSVIEAAYAMSAWTIDPSDETVAALRALAARYPASSDAQLYLSWGYLVQGDVAGYIDQRQKYAALAHNRFLNDRVAAERAALAHGGASAALDFIANAPPGNDDAYEVEAEWPATAAAMLGQRSRLLALMARDVAIHNRWSTWRAGQPRFDRWRGDRAVMEGLARLHALPKAAG